MAARAPPEARAHPSHSHRTLHIHTSQVRLWRLRPLWRLEVQRRVLSRFGKTALTKSTEYSSTRFTPHPSHSHFTGDDAHRIERVLLDTFTPSTPSTTSTPFTPSTRFTPCTPFTPGEPLVVPAHHDRLSHLSLHIHTSQVSRSWSSLATTGEVPGGREGHAAAVSSK